MTDKNAFLLTSENDTVNIAADEFPYLQTCAKVFK